MARDSQKKLAARVLKCGKSRIWFDPARRADISDALTAHDIKALVKEKAIKKLPKKGTSSFRKKKKLKQKRKGRRKGPGSRKGKFTTRTPKKKIWVKKIRIIRALLSEMKKKGEITKSNYRQLYRKAKSGYFRSRNHLLNYITEKNMVNKNVQKKKKKEN